MPTRKTLSLKRAACAWIPTGYGDFLLCVYENDRDDKEHLAFVFGAVEDKPGVLTRVHSECFTGDVLGSRRCDCGPQLDGSLHNIAQAGAGILVYLRQEGRGIGLIEKLKAYNLQDEGYDTVDANLMLGHDADLRDYEIAAAILSDWRVRSIRLLTNNPAKMESLRYWGTRIDERVPIEIVANTHNAGYLNVKARKMRHWLGALNQTGE